MMAIEIVTYVVTGVVILLTAAYSIFKLISSRYEIMRSLKIEGTKKQIAGRIFYILFCVLWWGATIYGAFVTVEHMRYANSVFPAISAILLTLFLIYKFHNMSELSGEYRGKIDELERKVERLQRYENIRDKYNRLIDREVS